MAAPSATFAALAALLLAALASGCELGERDLPYGGAPSAQRVAGQRLLAQYQCGSCHAIPGVPIAQGVVGPPLSAYGRRSYIAGHLPNRPDTLAQWIVAPAALVPGTAMPAMGVSPQDARDMAAYLLALE
ncbi:cytochrome c1 [Variovorax boronicumulans]|uniref:Cytochrome c1 n=1 Tax=Variovorax boronicumulans TaxID=436515 RepID=A0AAW8D3D8_9BURK|nr:c-type cytochrome [Variovorax boronicumulans]MDP9895577.1 cytochrome c1 [Variovorax boronicumulans]MDQ0055715.1 cytochrome c1 [Variovorax boronicumulans]